MQRSLDAILAAAEARLRTSEDDRPAVTERRVMVASRTVCKLAIAADAEIDDDAKAQIETIPEVLDALAGRTVTKWLISPVYINLIPGEFPAAGGEFPSS